MTTDVSTIRTLLLHPVQFLIPNFQRHYSWERPHWSVLWEDIQAVCKEQGHHFMGSLVSGQGDSSPGAPTRYVVIDGQQRLTTLCILLISIRDKMAQDPERYASLITTVDSYLINERVSKDYQTKLKLLKADRASYTQLIYPEDQPTSKEATNPISECYKYFSQVLSDPSIEVEPLLTAILDGLTMVTITTGTGENLYGIFESLNGKGSPLNVSDRIKNYLFMNISVREQEGLYEKCWLPLEARLGGKLDEFIKHYLIRFGGTLSKKEVFDRFKQITPKTQVKETLKEMEALSVRYEALVGSTSDLSAPHARLVRWVKAVQMSALYPILIAIDIQIKRGELKDEHYWKMLNTLVNVCLRRFISGLPSNKYTHISDDVTRTLSLKPGELGFDEAINVLAKTCPGDKEVKNRLPLFRLYEKGKVSKTHTLLEIIELSYGHKESADVSKATIEHVMPQKLSPSWKQMLGPSCNDIHETYLHTLGNLTLSAYNQDMGNQPFASKLEMLAKSHYELNGTFKRIKASRSSFAQMFNTPMWHDRHIMERGASLTDQFIKAMPALTTGIEIDKPVATKRKLPKPNSYRILGNERKFNTWQGLYIDVLSEVHLRNPSNTEKMSQEYPTWLAISNHGFTKTGSIVNSGYYAEINLGSDVIKKRLHDMLDVVKLKDEFSMNFD